MLVPNYFYAPNTIERKSTGLKQHTLNYRPRIRSGRIFSNRMQSNYYFEVIGVTDYRCQKIIVTKYPDPDAAD